MALRRKAAPTKGLSRRDHDKATVNTPISFPSQVRHSFECCEDYPRIEVTQQIQTQIAHFSHKMDRYPKKV